LICLSAAACQTALPESTATAAGVTDPPETDAPIEATVTRDSGWVNFSAGSLSLSLRVPAGWEVDTNDEGIVLAEHIGTMESGGVLDSVQVHCFIHPVDDMITPDESNRAVDILDQIIHDQAYIGPNDVVSTPVGFTWDSYDAAYYLLNNGDGDLKMLLALAISDEDLIACAISAPHPLAARIRRSVPIVLKSLTVNGHQLDSASLDRLPDPLVFPEATADVP